MDSPIDSEEIQAWTIKWGSAPLVCAAICTSSPPPYRVGDLIQKAMRDLSFDRIEP